MISVDPLLSSDTRSVCPPPRFMDRRGVRIVIAVFGWLTLAVGVVGLFVPLMPTTVFLLIALWALSQSSAPGYRWLREHPKLGHTMRAWDEQRAIPPKAKLFAIGGLVSSEGLAGFFADDNWALPVVVGVALVPVAIYIATRPSGTRDTAAS